MANFVNEGFFLDWFYLLLYLMEKLEVLNNSM